MTLDKAIAHKKEHRKEYHGAKSIDRTCCNHGSDEWEKSNRLYSNTKREVAAIEKEKEFETEVS